jgi:rSAM/selenodomain-associated transferase 2/rSAM/selenodomain-associated transferase 1
MSRETLILFTRFPRAGRAKTRLIPRLGAAGAAQLQREMTEHVVARLGPILKRRGVNLEVRFEDGSAALMRRWLGRDFKFTPQGDGDLGARMRRATNEAFAAGAKTVMVIGADCPDLDGAVVGRAFDSLRAHSLVFGPAKDGGYYLVGLREPLPSLFEGVAWGTSSVLEASAAKARSLGLQPFLLPELSDVDEWADLVVWEKARCASRSVSVIIPTLNEAEHLPLTLSHARAGEPLEIIVADGGSRDETLRIAQSHGASSVKVAPGRARQMNEGAAVARGETFLFLHADTLLPATYRDALLTSLRRPDVVGGAFRFRLRDPFRGRWLVEGTTNLRSRLWRMPYGDQALFVRRWIFDELGGFSDLPIMEDYEFVRRLRRIGKLALLEAPVLTSARRWQHLGFLRTTIINRLVILGFRCGVSPAKLAALYRGRSLRRQTDLATTSASPETTEA